MAHGCDTSITLTEPPAVPVRHSSPALFSKVLDGDIPSLKSCKSLLEAGSNTMKPGELLGGVYFWVTAEEQGLEEAEHVSSIGHSI
jgi:hypothetical protein